MKLKTRIILSVVISLTIILIVAGLIFFLVPQQVIQKEIGDVQSILMLQ